MIQYRVTWAASSNVSFHGATEWQDWGGDPDATHSEVENELNRGKLTIDGLVEAIEASGFDWAVETREV